MSYAVTPSTHKQMCVTKENPKYAQPGEKIKVSSNSIKFYQVQHKLLQTLL